MYEFDSYVRGIIKDLKISKKQKNELAEEFKDHLEMLKIEHIEKGFSEEAAVKKAVMCFGNEVELKEKLSANLYPCRNVSNILLGVVFYLLIVFVIFLIGSKYPFYENRIAGFLYSNIILTIMISSLGYFLPMFFTKLRNIRNMTMVSMIPNTILWVISIVMYFIDDIQYHQNMVIMIFTADLIHCLVRSFISTILGATFLKLFNNMPFLIRNMSYKRG